MASIAGVIVPTVGIVLTLPTTRQDGTSADPSEIQSATILRDPGTGPATLTVLPGPFSAATATYTDAAPATGSDIYSFFCTDTFGTQGATSVPVSVSITGVTVPAALAAGTLTATANVSAPPVTAQAAKPVA